MCHSWNCLLLQLWHLIYICCWQDNGVRSKKSKGKTTARRTSKKKQKTWRVCTKICVHHTFLYHFIYVVTTVVLSFMSLNVYICVLVCLYLTICLLPFTFLPCSPKTMTKKKKDNLFLNLNLHARKLLCGLNYWRLWLKRTAAMNLFSRKHYVQFTH